MNDGQIGRGMERVLDEWQVQMARHRAELTAAKAAEHLDGSADAEAERALERRERARIQGELTALWQRKSRYPVAAELWAIEAQDDPASFSTMYDEDVVPDELDDDEALS
jgi:hypothetical protein